MSRFQKPEVSILKISDGDTLTVRRRLNAGETRAALAQMTTPGEDGTLRLDTLRHGLATMVAYLVDWSLTDDDGQVVVIRDQPIEIVTAALDALDTDSYEEVRDALLSHDVAVRKESEQAKKDRAGANGSSAISPLPVPVTGDTSGSQHSQLMSTTS